jgi:hypothetical protein
MAIAMEKQIIEELKSIKDDLNYIKERVTDIDLVLTDDDFDSLYEAEKELKAGKTKRL